MFFSKCFNKNRIKHLEIRNIKNKTFLGLTESNIFNISKINKEPGWLTDFRMEAYKYFKYFYKEIGVPYWCDLKYSYINFNDIVYFSKPILNSDKKKYKIKDEFKKIGVNLDSESYLTDAILDSVSVASNINKNLISFGIIFCSFSEAVKKYPNLVEKYLSTVVSYKDNLFSSLNSSVFSDGSFCYIPKDTVCPMELSTYFRINSSKLGQFERTLIIVEENSSLNYIEGCSASLKKENQLHSAVVELICFKNSHIKYSTIQNWYSGDKEGFGGIYNFVTKRGMCKGEKSSISLVQVESGSSCTWKYPSTILYANESKSEFFSVSITKNNQQADTGTKIIHIGENTSSFIISKSIVSFNSTNNYRGIVKILNRSFYSKSKIKCDSMLITKNCRSGTFPYNIICNELSRIEHEDFISKVSLDQIFYCQQRGFKKEFIVFLIVNGFCSLIFKKMPMEFSIEAQRLLKENLDEIYFN